MKDYFEVLDIDEQSGQHEIKKAYMRLLNQYPAELYPDRNREIEEAYEALTNPVKRYSCIEFHRMSRASKQAYSSARKAMDKGEYAEAAKTLEKALEHEKHTIHIKYVLGIAYLNMDKPVKAVRMLEPVQDKFPNDIELNIIFIKACLEAREYDKALVRAEECYHIEKNNFMLVKLLVDGYQMTKQYEEALAVLTPAFENPAFYDRQYIICLRTAYILFLDKKYDDSLKWLDRLASLQADEIEKAASVDVFMAMLDFYIAKHMLSEAGRCAGSILKLMPDRSDIVRFKRGVELILRIEPEVDRFDQDEFIPDLLKIYIASAITDLEAANLTEEQQRAYLILIEHQLLSDYSSYLIAARYLKTNYPALYELKADFLDAFQDSRERRKLSNKNKVLFTQYQDVIAHLMEELSREFSDGYDWDDEDWEDWYDDEEYDDSDWDDEEGIWDDGDVYWNGEYEYDEWDEEFDEDEWNGEYDDLEEDWDFEEFGDEQDWDDEGDEDDGDD